MRRFTKIGFAVVLLAAAAVGLEVFVLIQNGLSARDEPTAVEEFVARRLRRLAVPWGEREARNSVALTDDVLARARVLFAHDCATCHGNDGHGKTTIGQNLYPKAPDMWLDATQSLSDGEIFWIIENGVRRSGMPAFALQDERQTWELVHFIRHLPKLTPAELAEMELLNPKSRKELEAARKFPKGGGPAPAPPASQKERD